MMSDRTTPSTPTLLTFAQFAERHAAFPVNTLRWLRVKADPAAPDYNGFGKAFVRVCGRVLVDEQRLFQIIDRQNGRAVDAR